jgi:hypothetical protein
MKLFAYTCLLIPLLAVSSQSVAAVHGETDIPELVPPTGPLEAYYDALADVERTVDAYFHAALRQHIAVTDAKLRELDAALEEQARLASGSDLPRMLTVRELVIRAKLTLLRELDEQFAGGHIPAEITRRIQALEAQRQAAIDLLIEGGEL